MSLLKDLLKTAKEVAIEWKDDIVAGISFGGIATWLKYVFQHFLDIGWTCMAALAVVFVNHYSKKFLIPWVDKTFKLKKDGDTSRKI